ncbi:MAG TPA: ABC transporter permease [Acidimicrobiales bacterium]|nr:ABC transporter permease [Acidimicrobiales bacterium]
MTVTITEPLAPAPEDEPWVEAADPLRRRRIGFGMAAVVLGLIALVAFGFGSDAGLDFTFVFSREADAVQIPDLTLPARTTAIVLGIVIVALGTLQVVGVLRTRIYLVFGIALALFVVALLAWAARGDDISIIGLLDGALRRSIPLAFGALAGLLCERSGIINIGIEGMLLTGAFVAAITASAADNTWVGLLCGVGSGVLLGAFLGVMSIRYRVDQIIGGTVINFFALGMTSYLTARVLVEYPHLNEPGSFRAFGIPGLDRLPFVGPLLFDNTIYVYLLFVLVFGLWWALFRSRWGLRVRAVGEHPRAADTVGINVLRTRYRAVILGGAVAGLGGTWFTLDAVSSFDENMTAGRGFIALAALILGRWHPVGAFMAALVFGFSEELQQRLAVLDTPIPSEFLLMTPYVVTIIVVAGLVGRSRPPAADGVPYVVE